MDKAIDKATAQQLEKFLAKLKDKTPQTELLLQVRKLPDDKSSQHRIVLTASNPAFQFEVEAGGDSLESTLVDLEASFSDQVQQRKALIYMIESGIDTQSPQFTNYLH